MRVINALEQLLSMPQLRHIEVIVFDLDGTLGPLPGWDGVEPLWEYVSRPHTIHKVVHHLRHKMNIKTLLVSRNSMFCGEEYHDASEQAQKFGFDFVAVCSRKYSNASKTTYVTNIDPAKILLFDDQPRECAMAAQAGSYAIETPTELLPALLSPQIHLYAPEHRRHSRRRTTKRKHT